MMKKGIILAMVLSTLSTYAQEIKKKVFYIGAEKTRCELNNNFKACYKMKVHEDSAFRSFPYDITGFSWEAGVQVKLEVNEIPLTVADEYGLFYTYELIRVIETRNMVLNQVELLKNNTWKLMNIQIFRGIVPFAKRANVNIEFNVDSMFTTGFSGCNNFKIKTAFEDGGLHFETTNIENKVSCKNDSIETLVMGLFTGESNFYFKNNILYVGNQSEVMLHFRPTRRLDSLAYALSLPKFLRGNTFLAFEKNVLTITLDEFKELETQNFEFLVKELTSEEANELMFNLVNKDSASVVKTIKIYKKILKVKDYYEALVTFSDGTEKKVIIKDVRI